MGWRHNSKSKTNVNKHGTVHGVVFFKYFIYFIILFLKEMRNDISQNNKEMKSLREDVRTMQVNWEKEKLNLEEKITKTEEKIEKLEKDKIRNNL
jgi:hypothetical protein